MHSTELVKMEPFEEQGLYDERLVLNREILQEAVRMGTSSATSLEVLDAVLGLLRDQVQGRMSKGYQRQLASGDIRQLYEGYTKLGLKLQLGLPAMRFRDWEEFDLKFSGGGAEQNREIVGYFELEWFEEPVRIVREAIESGWAIDLYSSVDTSTRVGWPQVVLSIESLKRTFAAASGPDDYTKVASGAKTVLQRLSDSLWSEGKYSVPSDVEDGSERIKNRLHTVIVEEFKGQESDYLVKLMKSANDFADQVRHKRNPSRYEAVVAADAALFLVNVLWLTYSNNRIDGD